MNEELQEENTQTEEDELIPLVGEEEGKETEPEEGEEEKETPSESSTEEKPEEESVSDEDTTSVKNEETEESKKEEWSVEGLQKAKEKLLDDLAVLRQEKRSLKGEPEKPVFVKPDTGLDDIAPSDVELVEKILKAKGVLRKDDFQNLTYSEQIKAEQNSWLEKHSEYLPKNDPHDIRWGELKETFDRYYKMPSNPREIGKILDLIHSQIAIRELPKKSSATVAASKEKLKVVSKSAGGGGGSKESVKRNSSVNRNVFSGFSDDELDEMGV